MTKIQQALIDLKAAIEAEADVKNVKIYIGVYDHYQENGINKAKADEIHRKLFDKEPVYFDATGTFWAKSYTGEGSIELTTFYTP